MGFIFSESLQVTKPSSLWFSFWLDDIISVLFVLFSSLLVSLLFYFEFRKVMWLSDVSVVAKVIVSVSDGFGRLDGLGISVALY